MILISIVFMKKIFIIGAGRSSATLIRYLEEQAPTYGWEITVGDQDINLVNGKITQPTRAIVFNVFDEEQRDENVECSQSGESDESGDNAIQENTIHLKISSIKCVLKASFTKWTNLGVNNGSNSDQKPENERANVRSDIIKG